MGVTDSIFGVFGKVIDLADKVSDSSTANLFLDQERKSQDTQTPYGVGGQGVAVQSGQPASLADSKHDGIPIEGGNPIEKYGMYLIIIPVLYLAIKILKK